MKKLLGLWVCVWLVGAAAAFAQTSALAQKSQQAHELMVAGKFEQAIPIYQELVKAAPEIETQLAFVLNQILKQNQEIQESKVDQIEVVEKEVPITPRTD